MYKKVLAFLYYYQRLDQLCERLDMAIDDFIVPVICETPERKELLRKRLYELGPTKQESSIFWLADRTSLNLEHPQQLLYGEGWTTAAGGREVSLLSFPYGKSWKAVPRLSSVLVTQNEPQGSD